MLITNIFPSQEIIGRYGMRLASSRKESNKYKESILYSTSNKWANKSRCGG